MRRSEFVTIAVLLMLPMLSWAYEWDKDMVDQP